MKVKDAIYVLSRDYDLDEEIIIDWLSNRSYKHISTDTWQTSVMHLDAMDDTLIDTNLVVGMLESVDSITIPSNFTQH